MRMTCELTFNSYVLDMLDVSHVALRLHVDMQAYTTRLYKVHGS